MTVSNKPGLRKCVDLNCKQCIYDPGQPGTWRQQVTLCNILNCPMHPVRPITKYRIPGSVARHYVALGHIDPEIALKHGEKEPVADEELIKAVKGTDS